MYLLNKFVIYTHFDEFGNESEKIGNIIDIQKDDEKHITYTIENAFDTLNVEMENIVKLWTPTIGELVCKKFTKKMFVVGAYGISGFTEHHLLRGEIQPFLGKSPTFYV